MIVGAIFRLDVSFAATVNFLWCIILYYFIIILLVYLTVKDKAAYSSRVKKFYRKKNIKVIRYVVMGWIILSILLLPFGSMITDFI
jgi:hypothetical protein